jgi:transcriptional regulator GlxA family with amidase domain
MKIGLLLYRNCMPSGLFYFLDLVKTVNSRFAFDELEVLWVAEQAGPIACAHGMSVQAGYSFTEVELDALLIPGFWGEGNIEELMLVHQPLVEQLKQLPKSMAFWSYCTGVALHAATHRLNHQRATITWWMAEYAKKRCPTVAWHNNLSCIYNKDSATSSGANGYIQIFQHLIQSKFGDAFAREVSKFMVLPRPYLEHLPFREVDLVYLEDKLMKKIFLWTDKQAAKDLTVANLAQYLNLSERTLARRVSEAMDKSVMKFMEQIKINQASEQLIFTSLPINIVSETLGYSGDNDFRRTFKRLTGLTPKSYRDKYRKDNELAEVQRDLLY